MKGVHVENFEHFVSLDDQLTTCNASLEVEDILAAAADDDATEEVEETRVEEADNDPPPSAAEMLALCQRMTRFIESRSDGERFYSMINQFEHFVNVESFKEKRQSSLFAYFNKS
jgi:hypothetical protein